MVALGATCYGSTSSYFFQQEQHLNGQTYHDKLLPFYQKEDNDTKIGSSNRMELAVTQQSCKKNFKFFIPKDRWAPNSLELNFLDYSI